MSKPVRTSVKDSGMIWSADLTDEEREIINKQYSQFGEYFMLEIDFVTKTAKLLPITEWR